MFATWTARMRRRLAAAANRRAALRELRLMSERDLKDLGIGGSELAFAVREGRGVHPDHGARACDRA